MSNLDDIRRRNTAWLARQDGEPRATTAKQACIDRQDLLVELDRSHRIHDDIVRVCRETGDELHGTMVDHIRSLAAQRKDAGILARYADCERRTAHVTLKQIREWATSAHGDADHGVKVAKTEVRCILGMDGRRDRK